VHAPYGGYVTRSIDHWRWSILNRPGVLASDILIVEWREQICAYAVLSSGGRVLEFAVATEPHRLRRRRIFLELLQALEDRARQRGDDTLQFVAAADDRLIDTVLRKAGYVVDQGGSLSLGVLNPAELIRRLLAHHAHRLPAQWCSNFSLEISRAGYRSILQPQLRIVINRRSAIVDDTQTARQSSDCLVTTDLETLTAIVFGQTDFDQAIRAGMIVVKERVAADDARTFFAALTIVAPWYTPLADAF